MARRARDSRRALDVNGNCTRMQNRAIVYAHACVLYTYVRVHGAALRMCLVRPPGCRLCGAYAAHMRLRLVLSRMSLLWRAVQVDLIARVAAQRSMRIYMHG